MRQSVAGKNLAFFTFWTNVKKSSFFEETIKLSGHKGYGLEVKTMILGAKKVTKQGHYNGIRRFVSSWCRYTSTAKNLYTTKNHEKWKYNWLKDGLEESRKDESDKNLGNEPDYLFVDTYLSAIPSHLRVLG